MKVALIAPSNVCVCPYIQPYSDAFEEQNINYDIISWDRLGVKDDSIQYGCIEKSRNPIALFWAYHKYASFVQKVVEQGNYDRLIVFSSQLSIFLYHRLLRKYNKRFILDFRDLSIEQKQLFKPLFKKVLNRAAQIVVSSPGFIQYLPSNYNYIVTHNLNVKAAEKAIMDDKPVILNSNPIDVLTIGGIRDFESNVQVIEKLANQQGFTVRFVGRGPSAAALQQRANELKALNVSFEGFYPKEKEKGYIEKATFLNIFYPRRQSHDSAVSNRFYNSLILRKPMITTKDTTQGYFAEKYNVGIAIENCQSLDKDLQSFIESFDSDSYVRNCNELLKQFIADYYNWEKMLIDFVKD